MTCCCNWSAGYGASFDGFTDFFFCNERLQFDPAKTTVEPGVTRLLYLHGALHLLIDDHGVICKRRSRGASLLAQFGHQHETVCAALRDQQWSCQRLETQPENHQRPATLAQLIEREREVGVVMDDACLLRRRGRSPCQRPQSLPEPPDRCRDPPTSTPTDPPPPSPRQTATGHRQAVLL